MSKNKLILKLKGIKRKKIRLLLNEIEIEIEVGWLQFGRAHDKRKFFFEKEKKNVSENFEETKQR